MQIPTNIDLIKYVSNGNQTSITINLEKSDTLLYVDSLLPNTNYTFLVTGIRSTNGRLEISNNVQATTMDTTSHKFIWQKFLFGEEGTSEINDIAIIDDNNIWAIGSIWQTDPQNPFYNAVHWNVNDWELKKVMERVSHNNNNLISGRLISIYASSSEDIWFSSGGQLTHWDGENWGRWRFLFDSLNDTTFHGTNKLGGVPSKTAWAVGNKGNLFNSRKNLEWGNWESWEKVISGKNGNFYDVCGVEYSEGNLDVYLPMTNLTNYSENTILKIDYNRNISSIPSVTNKLISSIWTLKGFPIYLSGDGIFENKRGTWTKINFGANIFIERIRGNALNDIFAVGHFGLVTHYNGKDWKIYPELEMNGIYQTISANKNIVAFAGIEFPKAVIIIGIRE